MLLDFTKRSSYNKVYLALTIMLFISDIIGQKATTINSITLILLFITLLLEGNFREKANRLYKEPLFYIISCYFLLCLLSIFVSKDVSHAKFIAQREMSIFVVPIIFLSKESFPKRYILFLFKCFIISAFVWMCTATILASNEYITGGDYHVFFYHSLVEKVDSTAIYASMVCIISIILIASVPFPAKLKSFLYLAFTVWIILLSSRMFLFIYTILLVTYIFRLLNGRYRLIAIGISIAVVLTLYMTKNPIKDRFEDLGKFKTAYLSDKKFNNNIYFDGLSLRLLYVRYSFEIMR
ncbi:hypothetical protein, partial [Arachidicoccus sp.]|uniref:hypothetical protein n=1 Tax=Arachidicoccus sp. TaxID=1872624 RepID=UPI003D225C5C